VRSRDDTKYLQLIDLDHLFASFFALHTVIHPRAVTEFIYRYSDPQRAYVFLSFQLDTQSRATEVAQVLSELDKNGMKARDISDNEMAKSHARYMIGGISDVPNERLFRFGWSIVILFVLIGLEASNICNGS